MKKIKIHEKGITLVALVVTIIVLLILSGITISTLIGENGIITRSKKAVEAQKYAQAKEEIAMAVMSAKMQIDIPFKQAIEQEFNIEPLKTNNKYNINGNILEGINREIYSYSIDLLTGEITDSDNEEIRNGQNFKIVLGIDTISNKYGDIQLQPIDIFVYKYADINSNGDIVKCKGFENIELPSNYDELKEVYKNMTAIQLTELGESARKIVKEKQIKPIITESFKPSKETLVANFETNKIDNCIWFIGFGNDGIIYDDDSITISILDYTTFFITKDGNGMSYSPSGNCSYIEATKTFRIDGWPNYFIKTGTLEISTVSNNSQNTENSIFVYNIEASKNNKIVYSNVALSIIEGENSISNMVEGIPIGSDVTVTEIYADSRYSSNSDNVRTYKQTQSNKLEFQNEFKDNSVEIASIQMDFILYRNEVGTTELDYQIYGGTSSENGEIGAQFTNGLLIAGLNNTGDMNIENIKLRCFVPSNSMSYTAKEDGAWSNQGEYYEYNNLTLGPGETTNEIALQLKFLNEEFDIEEKNSCIIVIEYTTKEITEE